MTSNFIFSRFEPKLSQLCLMSIVSLYTELAKRVWLWLNLNSIERVALLKIQIKILTKIHRYVILMINLLGKCNNGDFKYKNDIYRMSNCLFLSLIIVLQTSKIKLWLITYFFCYGTGNLEYCSMGHIEFKSL